MENGNVDGRLTTEGAALKAMAAAPEAQCAAPDEPCMNGCQMNPTGDPQNDCGKCVIAEHARLTREQLTVALEAQGALTETYRDIAMGSTVAAPDERAMFEAQLKLRFPDSPLNRDATGEYLWTRAKEEWLDWQARASLAAQPAKAEDCTEPDRAACPRLCIDFCNKAECDNGTPAPAMGEELPPDQRAAFESWMRKECGATDETLERNERGTYSWGRTCDMWAAWERPHTEAIQLIAEQNKLAKERQEWAMHQAEIIRGLKVRIDELDTPFCVKCGSTEVCAVTPSISDKLQAHQEDAEYKLFCAAHRVAISKTVPDASPEMTQWHADRHWSGKPGEMWRARACMALRQPAPAQPVAAQGEPVAWQCNADPDEIVHGDIWDHLKPEYTPLYTAPPPAPVAAPAVTEGWKPERYTLYQGDNRGVLAPDENGRWMLFEDAPALLAEDTALMSFIEAHPEMSLRMRKQHWTFTGFSNYPVESHKTARAAVRAAMIAAPSAPVGGSHG